MIIEPFFLCDKGDINLWAITARLALKVAPLQQKADPIQEKNNYNIIILYYVYRLFIMFLIRV